MTPAPPLAATTTPTQERLAYLDGLRGLAALFVTLHHVWQFVVTRAWDERVPVWFSVFSPLKLGSFGVGVFIVLSGYCLALPVARTPDLCLSHGLSGFFKRRARRILPPYYAALFGSALLAATYPPLAEPTQTQWDIAIAGDALGAESLLFHLTMVHNLSRKWELAINPPFWSVALEWQIYFVYALLLLPIWRRYGALPATIFSFVIAIAPAFLGVAFVHPWFLALFALGMGAAASSRARTPGGGPRRSAYAIAGAMAIAAVLLGLRAFKLSDTPQLIATIAADLLIGGAAALFLVECSARSRSGKALGLLGSVFSYPPFVKLGEFSYSLYLVHFPLLAVLFLAVLPLELSLVPEFALLGMIGVPLLLVVAYGFHLVFERPFMRAAPRAKVLVETP